MTDDQKSLARTLGIIAGAGAGLYVVTTIVLPPTPPRQPAVVLMWDNTPGLVAEIWSSTNLVTWTLKTNVAGTNRVTLPATNLAEFFKIRSRDTNGTVSDWARKPPL